MLILEFHHLGQHRIAVKYAEVAIKGSPFHSEVYDTSAIRVGHLPQGILGKPFVFEGDLLFFMNPNIFLTIL